MIQVIRFHVGDHGDLGQVGEERAVGLVRLRHEPCTVGESRVGTQVGHERADGPGRVEARRAEGNRGHGTRGGFPVRSGNGHDTLPVHRGRQCLRPVYHAQALRTRGRQFRVGGFDGRGDHHGPRTDHVLGPLPHEHRGSELFQFAQPLGVLRIRTAHGYPAGEQQPGHGGHTGPTHANEVHTPQSVGVELELGIHGGLLRTGMVSNR